MILLQLVLIVCRATLRDRAELALEHRVLRQQPAVLRRSVKRPKIVRRDQALWIALSKLWSAWNSVLIILKPETVLRRHPARFRLFWRWRSRASSAGRPQIDRESIALIRAMASENTGWGAPRIQGELRLLGHDVAESTVAKYGLRGPRRPPSQDTAGCEFFGVPAATRRLRCAFVFLSSDRRRIVHFNVTAKPTAECTAPQILQAFPDDEVQRRFLVRDRGNIYSHAFPHPLEVTGILQVLIAPRSPWQNGHAERVIGSRRCERHWHVFVPGEDHLPRILARYVCGIEAEHAVASLADASPRRGSERELVVRLAHHRDAQRLTNVRDANIHADERGDVVGARFEGNSQECDASTDDGVAQ